MYENEGSKHSNSLNITMSKQSHYIFMYCFCGIYEILPKLAIRKYDDLFWGTNSLTHIGFERKYCQHKKGYPLSM